MTHDQSMVAVGRTNVTRSLVMSFLLMAALGMQALAEIRPIRPIDDFNDGVADGWTTFDSTVGRSWGPGNFTASSGAYNLLGGGTVTSGVGWLSSVWDQSSDPEFSDGYVRATIRAGTDGSIASLQLRHSGTFETGFNTYLFFGTTANVGPGGNGAFLFNTVVGTKNVRTRTLRPNIPFDVNQDWNMEAGAVGDQISLKVWPVGEPEPESPQMVFTDRTLKTGRFGVESNIHGNPWSGPAQVSAFFDDIQFRYPPHEDPFALAPFDIYLWESPIPVPQVEGPFFVDGSPKKPDMRGDVTAAESWPDLRITGQVTDPDGQPIPGLKLDFWQPDDQGSYDNSGGYDLRGHLFTDEEGNYELWTVMPANYESIRTRHLHAKIGGENQGFDSWAYTTQVYFPEPYDNDVDADGVVDKVIEGGVLTDLDAIALKDDFITLADVQAVGAEFSDLASNILTLNNDPLVDGYFDTTLNIMMPDIFQAPGPLRLPGDVDGDGSVAFADFQILSDHFGMDVDRYSLGDLNGDGNVAFADFVILADNFGNMANEVAAVPEPSVAALLGFAVLLIGLVRRRPQDSHLR